MLQLLVVLASALLPACAATTNHVCIVDAGSSGSRGHCFATTAAAGDRSANATELFTAPKSSTPLSSFADNPAAAGASLSSIFDAIEAGLSAAGVNSTEADLYVLATAGMRLVGEGSRNAIFQSVRSAAQNMTQLRVSEGCCHAIPGQYEGVYGWLAAAYLLADGGETQVAAIDVGGASTQLTLQPDVGSSVIGSGMFAPFSVYGGSDEPVGSLFTQSKLRFGNDVFRERLQAYAGTRRSLAGDNPCFPKGYIESGSLGTGDAKGCASLVADFFGAEGKECFVEPCSFAGFYSPALPKSPTEWVLTGTVYYLWNDLIKPSAAAAATGSDPHRGASLLRASRQELSRGHAAMRGRAAGKDDSGSIGGDFTVAELVEKVEDLCGWATKIGANNERVWDGHDLPFKYSKYYCLSGTYIAFMLRGYGISESAPLHALASVGGTTVEWPLGAALAAASMDIPL